MSFRLSADTLFLEIQEFLYLILFCFIRFLYANAVFTHTSTSYTKISKALLTKHIKEQFGQVTTASMNILIMKIEQKKIFMN